MREIKFRVYDQESKKMISFEMLKKFNLFGLVFSKDKQHNIMQYTNQKNSKDEEIYEGDYVSIELDNGFEYGAFEGVVELIDGKWVVNNRINHYEELFSETEDVEILGNIYENPELLEVSND